MQNNETMLKRTFKLKTSSFAILSEKEHRSVVTIPAQVSACSTCGRHQR
jgi:hypothetical protein